MGEHELVERFVHDGETVVVCACGVRFGHYTPWKAQVAFDSHAGIENARAALKEAQSGT